MTISQQVSVEQVHNATDHLEHWLRMSFHPVAVKMLKGEAEVPEGAQIPTRDWGHKFSLCQSMSRAQREAITIAMFLKDMWCFEPVLGLGLAPVPQYFLEGHHRYPDSVRNLDDAAKWCQNMPHLEATYKGIVVGPANTCNFMPDVIVMHIDILQASMLTITKNWIDGRDIYSQLSGHAACVYAIVPTLKTGECNIAIPCKGDHRIALAQDSEILYSIPPSMLPDFVEGTKFLQEHGWGLPLKLEYKEEYDLKPQYAKEGEMLGMDLKQSPPRPQEYQKY